MPPKKKTNGYCMFMQAERQRIQAETKQTPSMQEMASLCNESWKNLSAKEKARYNAMANHDNEDRDKQKLNNQGQVIAERNMIAKQAVNRRTQENQLLLKSWAGQDILDFPFHVISFQVMYIEEPVDYFLPLEVGLVCFTLRNGITKQMHHFIDPGEVPQGSMHLALKHSESTHRIPLHFEKANNNFFTLWNEMERFVTDDSHKGEVPPIFCLMSERNIVESCMEFMHYYARTGEPDRLSKIYTLEDLVMSLLLQSGKVSQRPSETQILDSLLRNDWDYTCSIRCSYHDEVDCTYCSLAIVKRLSFSLFDMLSNVLGFKLTARHGPDEASDNKYTVLRPVTSNEANGRVPVRDVRHDQRAKNNSRSSNRSPSPPSSVTTPQPTSLNHPPARAWGAPTSLDHPPARAWGVPMVNRVEVTLDSDSDEDTDEIKSTADQHVLAELRKPKTPAMILPQSMPSTGLAYGRGFTLPGGRGNSCVVMEEPVRHPGLIRPPPGFVTRPGFSAGSIMRPQSFTRPPTINPWTQSTVLQPPAPPAASLGRGVARGRGMPRQV